MTHAYLLVNPDAFYTKVFMLSNCCKVTNIFFHRAKTVLSKHKLSKYVKGLKAT